MKAYTSRSRFDEARRFTGVFQQMGRVSLDADWNEEVLIRTADSRRRSDDLAHGSPDDGFRVSDEQMLDPVATLAGWRGAGLAPGDLRVIPPSLALDRREPETLPLVLRSQGHVALTRALATPLDLNAIPLVPSGAFAAAALVVSLRFQRPANDDDPTAVEFVLRDAAGGVATVPAAFGADLPERWQHLRIPVGDLNGLDLSRVVAWGVQGLPPRAFTWIDGLRALDASLRHGGGPDFVARGGDGTFAGAGRLLVDGVRACLERDVRYSRQPDLPDPPPLAELPDGGALAHVVYLDAWEQVVTALDDPFLREPALDGLDTTVRLQLLTQIKVSQNQAAGDPPLLPDALGGARLSTNLPAGVLPDRYPPDPLDPCRDRCLFTENAATGLGYTGAHNLHCRVEILHPADARPPVVLWSRDNGSTRLPLQADVPADALTLPLAVTDALALRSGDVVVISDRRIDRQPEGPREPVLRLVRTVDAETGTVHLADAGVTLTADPAPLPAGGPLGQAFAVADRAYARRWDGADWLLNDVRYNLADGLTFAFRGAGSRRGEYWTFAARVEHPDGAARGWLETLEDAPAQGPVHHIVPLARVTRVAGRYVHEDLRPRFLPLHAVRDRLAELADRPAPFGAFTLIVGDGVRTFGDIDQDLLEGVTADEALQSAVNRLRRDGGGSLYIRAGEYRLERPVLLADCHRLRILGDGEATALRVVGSGGAFILDGCGGLGAVRLERLSLVEAPLEDVAIGVDLEERPQPPEVAAPLGPEDVMLRVAAPADAFAQAVADALRQARFRTRRAFDAVIATLRRLRELQRTHPGQPLEDLPEAAGLLSRLRSLPHGVVTLADCRAVTLAELWVESREPRPEASGLLLTGSCAEVRVSGCRVRAAAAILAIPYGPYLSRGFLATHPKSGLDAVDLVIANNRLEASGDATHGIYLADGDLRGASVVNNTVRGYAVGITVRGAAAGDPATALGARIVGNALMECTGMGIDASGHDIEIADCSVVNAAPAGLFQAGIRMAGRHLRLRDCRIALPPAAGDALAGTPLGWVAAIVLGAGLDAGTAAGPVAAAVEDVEVSGCRVDGNNGAYPGIGLLVGGPQPALDVRVRDCTFRDLGDAAVRVFGHGGRTGRLRVEDNRIDRVALALLPPRLDPRPFLERVSPSLAAELATNDADLQEAPALLRAVVQSPSSAVAAPLDGALRWLSFHTLRGAVLFDQVEEGEILRNRITGVGNGDTAGQGVRTAAIAVIGGTDVVLEGNQIERVLARARSVPLPPIPPVTLRPPTYAVLEAFALRPAEGATGAGRPDVHAAATALRRLVLAYGNGNAETRIRIGRRIYAAMDALVSDLDRLGGLAGKIAASLVDDADAMRTAQGEEDHTLASHRVRATLSRAAAFTSGADAAREAWEAATQFDLAVVAGKPAPAARRLQDAAAELARGLPSLKDRLESLLADVIGAPDEEQARMGVADVLGELAAWRDAEEERSRSVSRTDLFGADQTVAHRFAQLLAAEAERLSQDDSDANQATLDQLRADKDALVTTIRQADPTLAADLETDWLSVERAPNAERVTRLRQSLARVVTWSAGGGALEPDALQATVMRMAERGNAALVSLVARHLDDGVGKLATEPEGMKSKGLKVLRVAASQMTRLVGEDREAAELAANAKAALRLAARDDEGRPAQLARARSFLDALQRRFQPLAPRPLQPVRPQPVAGQLDVLLPALAGVALSARLLRGPRQQEGLALFQPHFERALELARVDGGGRRAALRQVDQALVDLANGDAVLKDAASLALLRQLDALGTALAPRAVTPAAAASLVLLRAAALCLVAAEDEPTRLLRAEAHLRERSGALSPSVASSLAQRRSVAELLEGLHGALERLASGERPRVPELPEPNYSRQLEPADGVFGAALVGRLRCVGNQVQNVARGLTLLGAAGHPLAGTPPAGPGLVAQLSNNRFDGCVLGGLDLQPSGTVALNLIDNEVLASAGVAEAGPAVSGQAVAFVRGGGELVVQGNVFLGNGHGHPRALLHELALDWRGDVVVRGNAIRHVGGGAGGAGLLLLAETVPTRLAQRLARAPFLGIEPPPALPSEVSPGVSGPAAVPPLLFAGLLAGQAALAAPREANTGRLVQKLSDARLAPRMLTTALAPRVAEVATASADRYLDRLRGRAPGSLLEFVRRPPYRLAPPPAPPAARRSLHVEGNDVTANGPALLVVGEEQGDLLSATVVANGLRSEGGTGAAYVRHAESLVFNGNHCQAPDVVTVVAIRALAATLSISGNVILGREPVRPVPPPLKPLGPLPLRPGVATLHIPAGRDASVAIPLDTAKLRGSLEAFSGEAQKAFAKVLTTRAEKERPFLMELPLNVAAGSTRPFALEDSGAPEADAALMPAAADEPPGDQETSDGADPARAAVTPPSIAVGGTGSPFSAMLASAKPPYAIVRFQGAATPKDVMACIKKENLSSEEVVALLRGTELQAFASEGDRDKFVSEVNAYRVSKRMEELAAKSALEGAGEKAAAGRLFNRLGATTDTQADAVGTMTKLFTAQGFTAERTAAEVDVLLDQTKGDAVKALGVLQSGLFGKGDASPAARRAIEQFGLLEKVLAENVFAQPAAVQEVEEDDEPETATPPPDPYAHSLVILGGVAVAAVGNATTAGTLVRGARDSVELNV
jgi:hypothetical protein